MLLYFKVKNYRSIRDEAVLDMEAAGLHDAAKNLLPFGKKEYLPAVAIYGMVSHSFFTLLFRNEFIYAAILI